MSINAIIECFINEGVISMFEMITLRCGINYRGEFYCFEKMPVKIFSEHYIGTYEGDKVSGIGKRGETYHFSSFDWYLLKTVKSAQKGNATEYLKNWEKGGNKMWTEEWLRNIDPYIVGLQQMKIDVRRWYDRFIGKEILAIDGNSIYEENLSDKEKEILIGTFGYYLSYIYYGLIANFFSKHDKLIEYATKQRTPEESAKQHAEFLKLNIKNEGKLFPKLY